MKLTKYARDKTNPAVKGLMSMREILQSDWERNYKKAGVSFEEAVESLGEQIESGMKAAKLRNTILFYKIEDDGEALFHTVTADPYEVYMVLFMQLALGLHKAAGVDMLYTYVKDRTTHRMASKIFKDFVDLEESDLEDTDKYKLTIYIADFADAYSPKGVQ
tara:strand:+ start:772 stop:1257 length:486 start_codon:yes stop_codon:yes gene_type:complete